MIINLSKIDFGGVATGGGKTKPEERFDVQPTTSDQTITPTEGSVFSGGTVRAVTKEIDANIVSNNIKEGVTILGVAGTLKEEKPEESFNVQPTIAEQTITPTAGSVFSSGTVHAVTSSIDSNIQPGNIKQGVAILGVDGTLEEGITPAGTIAINLNGTYDVTNYASAEVNVGDTPDYRYMKGTIDKAGLKAIGWTDEDILTYEQNKTPHYAWENDLYKVSDENKELYSLNNLDPSSYKKNPNISYVPKKNMESYFAGTAAFNGMTYIKGIPFYDTSNVTRMVQMFYQCRNLTTIPLLDTSKVTSMDTMFAYSPSLISIPQLNTSNVTDMEYMFAGCSSLASIPQLNTSKVTSMSHMFDNCINLRTIPLLDTSNVTSMSYMFQYCTSLTNIPPLDTSNVTSMSNMFNECFHLQSIPQLDTSKVTNMSYMFNYCYNIKSVEGIDFSGLTSELKELFGRYSPMSDLTRFIVNGKINVSISDYYSIKALTAIDYDSVKSILAAADRTDNTNAKTLAFNRTMTDQNGELAALVSSCTSKGWTITGLTLQ